MEKLNSLVQNLLDTVKEETMCLQQINTALLQDYKLSVGGYLTVLPTMVDAYYSNPTAKYPYVDANMHAMMDTKSANKEIWNLQSNRFGKLYFHKMGHGGVDICLSNGKNYCLTFNLKGAIINGEEIWSQKRIKERILEIILEHEGKGLELSNKLILMGQFNSANSPSVVCQREDSEKLSGIVYSIPRNGMRRLDKNTKLPLSSFMDLWNKKLLVNNVQKVNLYMEKHPEETNVIKVLKEQKFGYIPTEIRIKYGLGSKARIE